MRKEKMTGVDFQVIIYGFSFLINEKIESSNDKKFMEYHHFYLGFLFDNLVRHKEKLTQFSFSFFNVLIFTTNILLHPIYLNEN